MSPNPSQRISVSVHIHTYICVCKYIYIHGEHLPRAVSHQVSYECTPKSHHRGILHGQSKPIVMISIS